MAKYYPLQGLVYTYSEALEITSIRSSLKVDLSLHETIEIQEPLELNPFNFYLELFVIADPNQPQDYTWSGEKLIELSHKKLYEPATTPQVEKIAAVRAEVISLLNTYHSSSFTVTAVVTRATPQVGGQTTNSISGSGTIVL